MHNHTKCQGTDKIMMSPNTNLGGCSSSEEEEEDELLVSSSVLESLLSSLDESPAL